MDERKVIHAEPDSETGKLPKLAEDEPISIELEGKRYTIEREKSGPFEGDDSAKALEGLRSLAGLFSDIDVEAFKRETLEHREQIVTPTGADDCL
jgi:hypothetical protein